MHLVYANTARSLFNPPSDVIRSGSVASHRSALAAETTLTTSPILISAFLSTRSRHLLLPCAFFFPSVLLKAAGAAAGGSATEDLFCSIFQCLDFA